MHARFPSSFDAPVVVYVKPGSFFAEHPEFVHPDFDLRIAAPPSAQPEPALKQDRKPPTESQQRAGAAAPTCIDCGGPRSIGSAKRCRSCYAARVEARRKPWNIKEARSVAGVKPLSAPVMASPDVAPPPTLAAYRETVRLKMEAAAKVWCEQCDRMVFAREAGACSSRFCKARALVA